MYSAAKVLLFCETNKYFARKMKISLTFFYFYPLYPNIEKRQNNYGKHCDLYTYLRAAR